MRICVLVFSGFNPRAVIAFLRTLEKNQVNYAIIAASENDLIFDTCYTNRILAIRKQSQLDLDDIWKSINSVKKLLPADSYLVAPSTEALNRFFLKNRDAFELENITIPLVDSMMYELVSDKYSFGCLCHKHGIKTPFKFSRLEDASVPFVAKPRSYFSKQGIVHCPHLIFTENDKKSFMEQFGNSSHFYYQEYIGGRSFYLLYYFHSNGNVYKFSQENYIQQSEGNSIVAAISSDIHLSEISNKYESLFNKINFRGLVMVETKHNENCYYMIEANPRFWGPSQLFVDSSLNLFEIFLDDYNVLKTFSLENNKKDVTRYFWFGGLVSDQNKNKKSMFYKGSTAILSAELPMWLETDIYNRPDTENIFKKEVNIIVK